MVNAHQGDQPLTSEEAAQQMKDVWARENQLKVDAWNEQQRQDAEDQGERDRIAREAEEARLAQQEAEAEESRKEADRKRPKLNPIDPELQIAKWIELRPSSYALNKLNNLEYVELDYFTTRGCRDAMSDTSKSVSHDTLTFTQLGDTFAIRPLAAVRPSKHIRNDEDLSWEEMMDAKNVMLHFMGKSGAWQAEHTLCIATFFVNLDCHPRKGQKNGKPALLLYQSRARREWFEALKRGVGFNLALIQDELLRSLAEEVNDTIRDRENATRDRELEQVRSSFECEVEPHADHALPPLLIPTPFLSRPAHLHHPLHAQPYCPPPATAFASSCCFVSRSAACHLPSSFMLYLPLRANTPATTHPLHAYAPAMP